MAKAKANGTKLKKAVEQFGSLENAVEHLYKKKLALQKQNQELNQENAELKLARDKVSAQIKAVEQKLSQQGNELQLLSHQVEQYGRQYALFESFLAMVVGSPSVTSSIETLIAMFQKLSGEGWQTSKNVDDLRSLFVRTILGDYLKCFRCDSCGARFIVDKEPHYKFYDNRYYCPACHSSFGVKQDDSFIKAMVSEEQLENTRLVVEFQKENDALKPLKVFLDLPCEICGQPMTEWTEQDVRRGVMGGGWGHTECWNTTKGQARQFAKIVREELERRAGGAM
jgi:hypothetical protein